MLVIVYLNDADCHIVVPENFIYLLNEKNLKNYGVNSNQNRLIYFSKDCFEKLKENGDVQQEYEPKFYLPVTKIYPLPENLVETCFIGRMYSFEGKHSKKCFILRIIS